jgi:hypothetical protein
VVLYTNEPVQKAGVFEPKAPLQIPEAFGIGEGAFDRGLLQLEHFVAGDDGAEGCELEDGRSGGHDAVRRKNEARGPEQINTSLLQVVRFPIRSSITAYT